MTEAIKQPVRETPFIFRAVWFVLFGWHLTAGWLLVAWILNVSIIGLPFGIWMLNRLPQVLTLKAVKGDYLVNPKSGEVMYQSKSQYPFILRALYFLIFGWWVSLGWAIVGYLLSVSIVFLPFGLLMLNRLPFITTLKR